MKEKIKNIVLYIGVFYMIVIPLMMIKTYFNMTSYIEINSSDEYNEEIIRYKNIISSYHDSLCKNYFDSLINKVDKDIKTRIIDIRKYYQDNNENNLLNYYTKAVDSCSSLTIETMKEKNMPIIFLTASIQIDEIMADLYYQYELGFKDTNIRNINETVLNSLKNNIKIKNELTIIEELINIIDWEKEV